MVKSFLITCGLAIAFFASPANAAPVFTDITPGSATFTATQTGQYQIDAYGAAAGLQVIQWLGYSWQGGAGEGLRGLFYLNAGEVLDISVGDSSGVGFGYDSTISHAGIIMIDAVGGDGGTSGLWASFNAGTNQARLPSLADLPQQVVDLFHGDPGSTGFDGPYVVIGNSTPGLVEISILPSVAAVPEPANWAMMLIGFGLLGSTIRRRTVALAESGGLVRLLVRILGSFRQWARNMQSAARPCAYPRA